MKIGLTAIKGNITQFIAKELYNNNLFDLSSALIREGYDEVGMDVGEFLKLNKTNTYITDNVQEFVKNSDVIVDFSSPELTLKVAKEVSKQNKTLIIGTRFLKDEDIEQLRKLADNCKIIYSENISISFNLMLNIIENMSIFLRDEYNINIISNETNKTNLPIKIAKTIARSKGWSNVSTTDDNEYNSINFSSNINNNKNEYSVLFSALGEDIEIKQTTFNPSCIVNGVIRSIIWSDGKNNGFYSLQDVLKMN